MAKSRPARRRRPVPKPAAHVKSGPSVTPWVLPLVAALAVLSALGGLYLGAVSGRSANLHQFPIAVVNEDSEAISRTIADGMVHDVDATRFDAHLISHDEALREMDSGRLYAVAVLLPGFTANFQKFAVSAANAGKIDQPTVVISTNPRAGSMGVGLATQELERVVGIAQLKMRNALADQVAKSTGVTELIGAAALALAAPIHVDKFVYQPLGGGPAAEFAAFYYALLLALAGVGGGIAAGVPVAALRRRGASRFRTVLVGWVSVAVLGSALSAVYLALASALTVPVPHGWLTWLYGLAVITAIGTACLSLVAALGRLPGALAGVVLFVVLGLSSSGAIVPLQAQPPFVGWLARFEPLRQVFLGTRALLYFDGRADAGLSEGWVLATVVLALGLLLGVLVTRTDGRDGSSRSTAAQEPVEQAAPESTSSDGDVPEENDPSE